MVSLDQRSSPLKVVVSSLNPPEFQSPRGRANLLARQLPSLQPGSLWDRLVRGTAFNLPAFDTLSRDSGFRIGEEIGPWALDRAIGIRDSMFAFWQDRFRENRGQLLPEYSQAFVEPLTHPKRADIAMRPFTAETFTAPTFGFAINLRTKGRADGADLSTIIDRNCNLLLPTPIDACTLVRCDTAAAEWFQTYPVIDAQSAATPASAAFFAYVMTESRHFFAQTQIGKLLEEAVARAGPRCGVALSTDPERVKIHVTDGSLGLIANHRRFELRLVPQGFPESGLLQYAAWAVFDHGHEVARSKAMRAFLLMPEEPDTSLASETLPRNPADLSE